MVLWVRILRRVLLPRATQLGALVLSLYFHKTNKKKQSQGTILALLAWILWKIVQSYKKVLNAAPEVEWAIQNQPILLLSATELARRIRSREITSRQLTDLFIQQIERINGKLNAIVVKCYESARAEADRADAILKDLPAGEESSLPPYFGVPCTMKEVFEMKGTAWTGGLVARKGILGEEDSPAVARMKKAGFIIMGKGNISEACMWMESYNMVYGATNNPYDLARTPGGSSGGEAANVSALGSPCAIGSDVGGSIRIPAFYVGLFGHKPTGGAVPNTRTFPKTWDEIQRYCQLGPLTRHAEDLMPLLNVIAGPDSGDTVCEAMSWPDPQSVALRGMVVLNCTTLPGLLVSRRHKECEAAQSRVIDILRKRGCVIKNVEFPELKEAFDIWGAMMGLAQRESFREIISYGKDKIWVWWEFVKWMFGESDHTLPALGLALVERLNHLVPARTERLANLGQVLKAKLKAELGDGVMVYPTLPRLAPKHHHPLLGIFDCSATGIFNVTGFPVTAVPCGLSSQGLPLGVQIVANHKQDHKSIAVALALEEEGCKWSPPRLVSYY